jgi:hypothetical protein
VLALFATSVNHHCGAKYPALRGRRWPASVGRPAKT